MLGRLEFYTRKIHGFIVSNTFYQLGSGLEVKKEFAYLQVPDGEGTYSWTDYNGDGVEQLNEFEVAVFQDQANYIRVYTPTDTYQKVFTNQFNEAVQINPAALWKDSKGLKKLISRFSNQFSFRLEHKSSMDDLAKAANPFTNDIQDSMLITLNSLLRNSLYFNRNHAVFSADFNYTNNQNKSLLTNGFETRFRKSFSQGMRWNISKIFSIKNEVMWGLKTNTSEYFDSKNYQIRYTAINPEWIYQSGTRFRLKLLYSFSEKENIISGGEEYMRQHKTGLEANYRVVKKGNFVLGVHFFSIDFYGEANSNLGFEMLEGYQNGNNMTWNLSYQRTMANNLQLNIVYNARKSEEAVIVHTANMQVRAFF